MKSIYALLLVALFAMAVSAAPASTVATTQELSKRCPADMTLIADLEHLLEAILPELKPLLDGVNGLEEELGKAIPLLGQVLQLLQDLCI